MQELDIRPLTGTLGAEIAGFDLKGISEEDFHQVLVFKEQHLPTEDHARLGHLFGPPHTHPAAPGVDGHPEILLLRNRGKNKNITQVWHSDVSCEEEPPSISILQAIEVPPAGGDTMWADQYTALEYLSPGMRSLLEPMRAMHRGFEFEATLKSGRRRRFFSLQRSTESYENVAGL
jgi:taurine dioxygenase